MKLLCTTEHGCKSYIDGMWHGQKLHGYRVFLSGLGGTGKSHELQLIQCYICYMLNHTINPDDNQPLVLVTAPTGSAAFQVGGSTIHSAFLLYDKSRTKPSWEKHSIMQLKLQKMMLSITDEISMVSFKQYQQMNETMSIVKGTEEITKRVKVILVEFDNRDVGQEANSNSWYKHINSKAVPIYKTQAIFPVHGKTSCQASRTQFPLVLAWAITIHKCQGLTLPEIVVDMTPAKGHYTVGQAYVAFSRVTQLDKLHIIN